MAVQKHVDNDDKKLIEQLRSLRKDGDHKRPIPSVKHVERITKQSTPAAAEDDQDDSELVDLPPPSRKPYIEATKAKAQKPAEATPKPPEPQKLNGVMVDYWSKHRRDYTYRLESDQIREYVPEVYLNKTTGEKHSGFLKNERPLGWALNKGVLTPQETKVFGYLFDQIRSRLQPITKGSNKWIVSKGVHVSRSDIADGTDIDYERINVILHCLYKKRVVKFYTIEKGRGHVDFDPYTKRIMKGQEKTTFELWRSKQDKVYIGLRYNFDTWDLGYKIVNNYQVIRDEDLGRQKGRVVDSVMKRVLREFDKVG